MPISHTLHIPTNDGIFMIIYGEISSGPHFIPLKIFRARAAAAAKAAVVER